MQSPHNLFVTEGSSATFDCSAQLNQSAEVIAWYREDRQLTQLRLLGFLYNDRANPEKECEDKIKLKGSSKGNSSLSIYNLTAGDSTVYFCAARQHGAADPIFALQKTLSLNLTILPTLPLQGVKPRTDACLNVGVISRFSST